MQKTDLTMLTHEKIASALKKAAVDFSITKASYFGSYAEERATEDSDLDVLVEFDQPAVSILTIIRLKRYLEEQLEKPVEVIHAPLPEAAIIEIGKQVIVL